MRGRRVGAWAAAGRTHVRRPERDSPAHLSPVVCHETEFERGMHGREEKRKRKTRGSEKERKRTWNKEGRSSSYVPAYGKGYRGERRERKRARTRIDGKYRAQEHSRLGIKGVLYDAVVYGRGFYLITLPPVRISQ